MTSTDRHLLAGGKAGQELPADAEVPLSNGLQRQGDVLVLPTRDEDHQEATAIPAEGVMVVRGEAGGNGHLLLGDGSWSPSGTAPDLGVLHVATEAYLLHPEHAALGIAPGHYRLRRQREQTPSAPVPQAPSGPRIVLDRAGLSPEPAGGGWRRGPGRGRSGRRGRGRGPGPPTPRGRPWGCRGG
jgi:hypothetical protein